jgi:hypothetical protein
MYIYVHKCVFLSVKGLIMILEYMFKAVINSIDY